MNAEEIVLECIGCGKAIEYGSVCAACTEACPSGGCFEEQECPNCDDAWGEQDMDGRCYTCGGSGYIIPEHCCACGGSPYCVCCRVCGASCVGDCKCPIAGVEVS